MKHPLNVDEETAWETKDKERDRNNIKIDPGEINCG
jgi:hypothetical protein